MSLSSDLRCSRAEASCARMRARFGDLGEMGEVEQLGQIGDVGVLGWWAMFGNFGYVGVWASLVVGEMEGENEPCCCVLEDVGDPVLMFNVRTLCSPSMKFVFQYRVVLGRLGCAMGMHPSC